MDKTLTYDESARCWLPAELEQVNDALARLETYLTVRGVSEEAWRGIELAVAEALKYRAPGSGK